MRKGLLTAVLLASFMSLLHANVLLQTRRSWGCPREILEATVVVEVDPLKTIGEVALSGGDGALEILSRDAQSMRHYFKGGREKREYLETTFRFLFLKEASFSLKGAVRYHDGEVRESLPLVFWIDALPLPPGEEGVVLHPPEEETTAGIPGDFLLHVFSEKERIDELLIAAVQDRPEVHAEKAREVLERTVLADGESFAFRTYPLSLTFSEEGKYSLLPEQLEGVPVFSAAVRVEEDSFDREVLARGEVLTITTPGPPPEAAEDQEEQHFHVYLETDGVFLGADLTPYWTIPESWEQRLLSHKLLWKDDHSVRELTFVFFGPPEDAAKIDLSALSLPYADRRGDVKYAVWAPGRAQSGEGELPPKARGLITLLLVMLAAALPGFVFCRGWLKQKPRVEK